MVNSVTPTKDEGLKDLLKPFYQRAADAEDRLSRLESELSHKNGTSEPVNVECSKKVKELELKLAAEREKVAKLTTENGKKDYRIIHLLRTIKDADLKMEKLAVK